MEYEVEGSRPRGRPKRTWKEVVWEDCQARKLNKEDAMDHCKWRKMIKEVRWTGLVWAGEWFFWYRHTRVVQDKRPLYGGCCCCFFNHNFAGAAAELARQPSMLRWNVIIIKGIYIAQVRKGHKCAVVTCFGQLRWNLSTWLTVQMSHFSAVLVDGLPKFQVKLEKAAIFSSSWACWFNSSTQFCFMAALLMRWQIIPGNFAVFCNRSNICHPSWCGLVV